MTGKKSYRCKIRFRGSIFFLEKKLLARNMYDTHIPGRNQNAIRKGTKTLQMNTGKNAKEVGAS